MVYILLGKGFEEVEATAPNVILKRGGADARFVSITKDKTVVGGHNISINADMTIGEVKLTDKDILVIPGGLGGVESLEKSAEVSALVKKAADMQIPMGAICAGPRVLAPSGVLKGVKAVCYPGMESQMGGAVIDNSVMAVTDGRIITGRGPGAAIAFGLELLKYVKGEKTAKEIAAAMTYDLG